MNASRQIERRLLIDEPKAADENIYVENSNLRRQLASTRRQFLVALRLNHGLTAQAVANARDS